MQNTYKKGNLLGAGVALTGPPTGEPSLAALALRIAGALLRIACQRASKVLSVGDCNVH